jgi:hypothetical protein
VKNYLHDPRLSTDSGTNEDGQGYRSGATIADGAVLLTRLCGLLDVESRVLLQFEQRQLTEIVTEKVRTLRDISKLQAVGGRVVLERDDRMGDLVRKTRSKLEQNMKVLEVHALAIDHLVKAISAVVEMADSDRTYKRTK